VFPEFTYVISAHEIDQLPAEGWPEIAVAGRSNAGKSSAINRICGRRGLAKTSKIPGRTQQLVAFASTSGQSLVDLPGYGFAQVTVQLRAHWQQVIGRYLKKRRSLVGLVLIMDSRRPLLPMDVEFLGQCAAPGLPVHVLLSKADKLSRSTAKATLVQTERALRDQFPGVSVQLFSSLSGDGLDLARSVLLRWWREGRPRLENKGDSREPGP
jgi:GTP-binding protein